MSSTTTFRPCRPTTFTALVEPVERGSTGSRSASSAPRRCHSWPTSSACWADRSHARPFRRAARSPPLVPTARARTGTRSDPPVPAALVRLDGPVGGAAFPESGARSRVSSKTRADSIAAFPPRPGYRRRVSTVRNAPQLITYPDALGGSLRTLSDLLDGPLAGCFGGVHLLPPFPSSGDRGFAPIDY